MEKDLSAAAGCAREQRSLIMLILHRAQHGGTLQWLRTRPELAAKVYGLDNQPCCTDEMKPGLEVWFQARHVIAIIRSDKPAQVSAEAG